MKTSGKEYKKSKSKKREVKKNYGQIYASPIQRCDSAYKKFKLSERDINKRYNQTYVSPILKLVLLVIISFAVIAFLRFGNTENALTFESFLSFLQNVPAVDYGWLNIAEVSLNLPDWLEWLNTVINFLASLIEVFGFLLAGIWQALNFILYFLRYLFLG